jgi:hypothetical protein
MKPVRSEGFSIVGTSRIGTTRRASSLDHSTLLPELIQMALTRRFTFRLPPSIRSLQIGRVSAADRVPESTGWGVPSQDLGFVRLSRKT